MRKNIFTILALMAALCACNKEQFNESEVTEPVVETSAPLVFTATMESTPGTKATLDGLTPSWEVADAINLNGFQYKANAAGTSSTFSMVGNGMVSEIRPTYVNGSPWTNNEGQAATMLVDDAGTSTKWCDHVNGDGLFIIVSTGNDCMLNSIKLWNGGDTGSRSGRRWKDVKVYGASSADGPWDSDALLASFTSLNLEANNGGFAGELPVNSTKECKYYRVEVLSTMGESLQQMSDMKFVVCNDLRPTFVSTTTPGSYGDNPPSNLVDDAGTSTRWIAKKDQRQDGVWNIVVSTGSPTLLNKIKLWNAENASTYAGRRWKEIQLAGKLTSSDAWRTITTTTDDLSDLQLEKNNYGLAGEININSSKPYTFYKIDILDNEGDDYIQMTDMKFTVNPAAPYYAYFPASLFDGFKASLPSTISETWTEGKFNMPMYAQSNTTDLEFKNLCGVLKITVKKETIGSVRSIRISSSNKAISGEFTVSGNTAVLTSPNETTNTLTVTYTNAVSTTDEGTAFYLAIPAQTYQNLKIEVSSDGTNYTKSMTTKKDVDIVVERNKIYPITITNPPTTGTAIAIIDGVEVYVPWVQLWKDGLKWAAYNVGATTPTDYGSPFQHHGIKEAILWGSDWRMPSIEEFKALYSEKCEQQWVTDYNSTGINGMLFTGRNEYAGNSIFLPASGVFTITGPSDNYVNKRGYYWTSTSYTGGVREVFWFKSTSYDQVQSTGYNYNQVHVREVLNENE